MRISEFTPDKEFPKNSVIIADYRGIDFENDKDTIQYKTAEKYGIELYPVIGRLNISYLIRNYGDMDWFVDRSLIKDFQ